MVTGEDCHKYKIKPEKRNAEAGVTLRRNEVPFILGMWKHQIFWKTTNSIINLDFFLFFFPVVLCSAHSQEVSYTYNSTV